jgi:hypothetical protein
MGALAFAVAGGGQNLVQSNWIRDKGFGMGHHVPKIVSPLTREVEARGRVGWSAPGSATSSGSSERCRCSPPPWASSTTPAGSPRTF